MSQDQQMPPPPSGKDAKRQAKADAAADKARAKAERPWYKKKRFVIPLAILLLIIIIAVGSGGGEDVGEPAEDQATGDQTAGDEAAEDQPAEDEAAEDGGDEAATTTGVGSPARDGSFEFTVDSFECGETTVGGEFFEEEAQGQFCLMSVRVENIGESAQLFSADNQYVFNEEGTQYSASFEATFANNPEGDELFTEINPGNAVEGQIVFDVPEDAEVAYAELHDSPFSGGVRVELQ